MKPSTDIIERLAEARVLDLEDVATPEEIVELGVELILVGTDKLEQRKRRRPKVVRD